MTVHTKATEWFLSRRHAPQNVAQLWTFANFPSYIKPVVFSWPTGSLMAYPYAQTKGAENDCVALALRGWLLLKCLGCLATSEWPCRSL